jgi:phosphatidylserine decarboxylase
MLTCQFLALTYNDQKFSTHAVPKTVNPTWNASFDVSLIHGCVSEVIEAVCWDRDRFRKEYLGEFCLNVYDLFPGGPLNLNDPANEVNDA